jgi:flagellar motility protein MotE (MotC chaperone)
MPHPFLPLKTAGAAILSMLLATAAHAEDPAAGNGKPPAEAAAAVAGSATPAEAAAAGTAGAGEDNASQYCRNIANAAADARYRRQSDALAALEKEIDDRIAKLDAKRTEYAEWLKRREDFMAKADASVVAIYSQMRADAAALQIAVMDPESAAAILSKLSPRTASAILNEMNPAVAAQLTDVMAGLPAKNGSSG